MKFDSIPELLINEQLALRGISPLDVNSLFQIYADSDILNYTDEVVHDSILDTELFIEKELRKFNEQKQITWCIVERNKKVIIGLIRIKYIDWKNYSGTIGYYLSPNAWGRGFATLALSGAVKFAFDKMGLHRIEAQVYSKHYSSIKVLEKVGFRKEGLLKENFWIQDSFEDSLIYGIVKKN